MTRKAEPSDAVAALRELGGRATATRLLTALTCDNCGAGFGERDAQLAMQRATDSGQITIGRDFTLSVGDAAFNLEKRG